MFVFPFPRHSPTDKPSCLALRREFLNFDSSPSLLGWNLSVYPHLLSEVRQEFGILELSGLLWDTCVTLACVEQLMLLNGIPSGFIYFKVYIFSSDQG